MSDPDVEGRLRSWYARFTPEDSGRAVSVVAATVASARASRGARGAHWLRPRLALAAISAAVLIAAVTAPIWMNSAVPPASTREPSRAPSAVPPPSPTSKLTAATTPQPISVERLSAAAVDDAGTFGRGGAWAVSGAKLMLSTNGGETWTTSATPAPSDGAVSFTPSTWVLDAEHAWTLRAGPGSHTGGQADAVSLLVYRTSDAGRTWQSAALPGNFAGAQLSLLFAGASDGFLVSVDLTTDGRTTVYRTSDGGRTWTAAPGVRLDWNVSISAAATIWASSAGGGAGCGHCGEPLLQVSRDSGRTWSASILPGYEGRLTSDKLGVAEAPLFLDNSTGYVAVNETKPDSPGEGSSTIFRTTDGGLTWTAAATPPYLLDRISILDGAHWIGHLTIDTMSRIIVTDDSGLTWHMVTSPAPTGSKAWFTDVDHGMAISEPGIPGEPARVLYATEDGGLTWSPVSF